MAMRLMLLGAARVEVGDEPVHLPLDKRGALLCHLASAGSWVDRDRLAYLFWPDTGNAAARTSLRQLLMRVKLLPYAADVELETERIRWAPPTDVAAFRAAVEHEDWSRALDLHRGPFCEGLFLKDAEGFNAWLELERDHIALSWQRAALRGASHLMQTGRVAEASHLYRELWELDRYNETVFQEFLRSTAMTGQRQSALDAFRRFQHEIDNDLGIEPSSETAALARAIERGEALEPPAPESGAIPRRRRLDPLIGRERELAVLRERLGNSDDRIVVLHGPGGVGKTRLALELAKEAATTLRHGSAVIHLEEIEDAALVPTALARAIGFEFFGGADPVEQLARFLREREQLLVFDGIEHVVEGASVVADLVERAANVWALVTSRRALDLPHGVHVALEGLPCEGDESEAVELFLQVARRGRPRYAPPRADRAALAALCRRLEGLPLALELAAPWTREMTCGEILEEIDRNLSLLSREGGGPHDSMRAVFESSWVLLSREQQRALTRLAIFRGGFTRLAAMTIAGATPYDLLSLQHRSLVARRETGRFEMHEIVRRLAGERIGEDREDLARRHAGFYAELLVARLGGAEASERAEALVAVGEELDNVRAAWSWLAETRTSSVLSAAAPALYAFCDARGYFREGVASFRDAVRSYEAVVLPGEDRPLLATLRLHLSWFCRHTGCLEEARSLLAESLEAFRSLGNERMVSVCLTNAAAVCESMGDLEGCLRFHTQAHDIVSASGDRRALAKSIGNLARIHAVLGRKEEAERFFAQAERLFEEQSDTKGLAIVNLNRGCLWLDHEEWDRAAAYFERSLAFARAIEMRHIEASNLINLAEIRFVQGRHAMARSLRQRGIRIFTEADDRVNVAFGTIMLGYDACRLGRLSVARKRFRKALSSAVELSATTLVLDVVLGVAMVLARENETDRAGSFAALVEGHAAATAEMRRRAAKLAAELGTRPAAAAPMTLDAVVEELLETL